MSKLRSHRIESGSGPRTAQRPFQRFEWDYDFPGHRRRRQSVVEILPPEPKEPRRLHVDVTVRRQHPTPQRLVTAIAIAFVLVMAWRFKFGVLMLFVLAPQLVFAGLVLLAACAIAAWRNGRRGRPF